MRIAMVCPYAWDRPGGVQSHIRSLAPVLRSRGHTVTVLAPAHEPKAGFDDATIVGGAFSVPANGSVAGLSFGPRAARNVGLAVRGSAPDVLHLHEPLIPSLSLLALWRCALPAVGTFHASAESSAGYRIAGPILSRLAEKLTVRTAVSETARDLVQAYFPGHYRLTPNGVDTTTFEDAGPADLGEGLKVLFVGRLEARKGLEVLIRAMAGLRDVSCELIVAGTGPAERQCRALAEELSLRVRFLGRVPEEQKAKLFRRADLFCSPALGGESFGIVLLEAMASGAPVVCSDLPGFRAVAGGAAVLVPPGDPERLADAIRTVLSNEGKAQEMRVAGKRIAGAFNWQRLVVNLENIYETATG